MFSVVVLGYSQYESKNGFSFPPNGTYRLLNICVNIIYDITPLQNPVPYDNGIWNNATLEGLNSVNPIYLSDFMDVSLVNLNSPNGIMTRLYHESSFGNLVLLGDFIVVNIKQSSIKSDGSSFNPYELMSKVTELINNNGGVDNNTIFGFDNFNEYDITNTASGPSNGKFDFIQYLIRNPTSIYGGEGIGTGHTWFGNNNISLLSNGISHSADFYSYQGVGNGDISLSYKSIVFHEFSHNLLGGNNFHTTGGNHLGHSDLCTFMGTQGGHGLMGGYGSALISCNAYERWRLNWRHPSNDDYPIAVQNINSDVDQGSGFQTFLLRDFVTYGDALRIKLPYKDSPSHPNQYIWIENHQISRNGKLDFFQWGEDPCMTMGTPGIYAYIQVGKDIISSNVESEVWPNDKADNLKTLSAEGNWDMQYIGNNNDCWGIERNAMEYVNPNPFCGALDIQSVFPINIPDNTVNTINTKMHSRSVGVKLKNGIIDITQPYIGDDKDAFVNNSKMNLGTNPTPSNTVTYNVKQHGGIISSVATNQNTRKIHLTGLEISFIESGQNSAGKIIRVDIKWNQYNLENDVRWTGEIVLREDLNILPSRSVLIDQNQTPNQHTRNSYTGEFSNSSSFTCDSGSNITLKENSTVILNDKSSFYLKPGATLVINDGSKLLVKNGCKLNLAANSNVFVEGTGVIEVDCGGSICMENGANVNLVNKNSSILLHSGYLIPNSCPANLSNLVIGMGEVVDLLNDKYIGNQQFNVDCTLYGKQIFSNQNVSVVGAGTDVKYKAVEMVTLRGDFFVSQGTTFEVNFIPLCHN